MKKNKLHYELTDETKVNDQGVTLYRMRYTEDLPKAGVMKGQLGGWLESLTNSDYYNFPRVGLKSALLQDAEIFGNAMMTGSARMYDESQLFGEARLSGDAMLQDNAKLYGEAYVTGDVALGGNAKVYGNVSIRGDVSIENEARISKPSDYMVVQNIGSENADALLYRTKDGYFVEVGCWGADNGLDQLMPEVDRRRANYWDFSTPTEAQKDIWYKQYEAFKALAEATISQWK